MYQPGYDSSIEVVYLLVFICLLFALSSALCGFYVWAGAAGLFVAVLLPYSIGYGKADGFASRRLERMRACGRAVRDFAAQHGRYPDHSEFEILAEPHRITASSDSRRAVLHYTPPPADAPGDFIVLRCDIHHKILGPIFLKAVIELQKNGTLRRR